MLLGNGTGTFRPASNFAAGTGPNAVAIADLNADNRPDLALSDTSSSVSVLLHTAPKVSLSLPGLTFSTQPLDTFSTAKSVTVTNTGNATLHVSRVYTIGANADDYIVSRDTCSTFAIGPSAACTLDVRFGPQATGASGATLALIDDIFPGEQYVGLSGTGGTLPQGPPGPQGLTGPRGRAGRRAHVTCRVRTKGNKKVRVTCTVRLRFPSARLAIRVGSSAPASKSVHGRVAHLFGTGTSRNGRVRVVVTVHLAHRSVRYAGFLAAS